ncbi:hypothetical protein CK203_104164 [Vitis vinifera]|uniref:Uncharacterized protein n=1 Tax=Vitis vinifera TaxID=29760 RepID=A0A438E7E2_VITVI|nr:hypothetical protein CK203_104164 [Vitis vinifera]
MLDIERYMVVGCLYTYLRLYSTVMRAHGLDRSQMITMFPLSLSEVSRRELEGLRQRSDEFISSFISHRQGKIAEIVDRPLQRMTQELTPEGAAWLMDLDGNRFSEPTNVDQLKSHHMEDSHIIFTIYLADTALEILGLRRSSHHPEAVGSDVVFDSLFLDRTNSVVFELLGSFARSLSLTGCSLRRGHDRYLTEPPRSIQLVSYFSTLRCHHASPSGRSSWIRAPLGPFSQTCYTPDAIQGHISILDEICRSSLSCVFISTCGSASLGIRLFSCFLSREMFPRRLDWIWITEITCLMIDDFISPDFRLIVHLMPHWGTFPSWGGLEIFMELHDHSHSRSTCWDDDLFTIVMMIPQWSISRVIQLGIHFSALRCHRAPSIREVHLSLMSVTLLWIRTTEITYLFSLLHDRPLLRDTCRVEDFVSLHHDSPMDLPLGHFIRFTLFDVSVIFEWSRLRLMDSRIVISSEPLFSVWRSEPLFRFGVQSHHFSVSAFRAITFSVSAFRAIFITSQYRRSEQLFSASTFILIAYSVSAFRAILITLSIGVQSHSHHSQYRRSEPSLLSIGVQSHHFFSIGVQNHPHRILQYRRSEPFSSLLSIGVQSHHIFSIGVQSPPHRILSIGVQSHSHHFSVSTFRAITFSASAFRAILIASQYWCSEPSSSHLCPVFRAIIITSSSRCSEPSSLTRLTLSHIFSFGVQSHHCLILGFGVQSRHHLPARLSEPLCLLVYDVQIRLSQHDIPSYHRRFISAFGAIGITPQFDVQSRIPVLVFRAVIISQLDVHSHLADFDIETPPPIYDSCFRWIVESLTPWAKSSQRT